MMSAQQTDTLSRADDLGQEIAAKAQELADLIGKGKAAEELVEIAKIVRGGGIGTYSFKR
ncbi:hypothetical protein HKCCE3408_05680 [Rhodobacterales bacterium HKCCE3408]|nr:hypothetical protein [Rhodobacterales bacterium HKCCE3408]